MALLFVYLYDFFFKHRAIFWVVFSFSVFLVCLGTSQIKLEEDVTKFFPDDERAVKFNYVFTNSKFAERLVVMVSIKDSTISALPDSLVATADDLVFRIGRELTPFVEKITSRVDEEKIFEVFNTVTSHLPIFLSEQDYVRLDSLTTPKNIEKTLEDNFKQIISPSGFAVKKMIARDPLGFSFLAIRKLQDLQYDENFQLYDGYVVTKDLRHLIFFVQPRYSPSETGANTPFVEQLNGIIGDISQKHPLSSTSFFGSIAVAVGNSVQLRKDTILTVSILVVLLSAFLIGFFRKKRVPFLILVPVAFGGLFSLSCIYLLKGSVSVLAIAAGSVILGIAVNYALHFLSHLTHVRDVRGVIMDLAGPMTLGSTTTVLAFFCLQFAKAAVLRDVGLFAGFTLIGAALASLVFLPQFLSSGFFDKNTPTDRIHKLFIVEKGIGKWISLIVYSSRRSFFTLPPK